MDNIFFISDLIFLFFPLLPPHFIYLQNFTSFVEDSQNQSGSEWMKFVGELHLGPEWAIFEKKVTTWG